MLSGRRRESPAPRGWRPERYGSGSRPGSSAGADAATGPQPTRPGRAHEQHTPGRHDPFLSLRGAPALRPPGAVRRRERRVSGTSSPGWSVVPRRSVGREPMTTNSGVATTCCTPPSSATAQPAGRQDLRSGSSPDPRFRSAPSTTGNAASRSRIRAMTVPNRYPHWATATSRFLSSKCVVHAGPANHSRIRRGSGSPHRAGRRWGLDRSRPG